MRKKSTSPVSNELGNMLIAGTVDEKELIFQSSNDLMMYIGKFGKLLKVNEAGLAFSGFSEDEVIGKMFWKLPGVFSKENAPKFLNVFKNALKGKPTRDFIGKLNDKSGRTHIMDFSAFPVKENKKLKYVFVVAKELTEQKETDARYGLISESTSDLICLTTFTLNPIYTYVSPSYKKVMGYEPDDLIGKPAFDFVHPDDKKNLLSLLKKYISMKAKKLLVKEGLDVSEKFEDRVRDKSGGWHYMENTANLMGDELLFVSKDITERKKVEKALDDSLKRYQNLADGLNAAVYTADAKTLETNYMSKGIKKIYGYTQKEWMDDPQLWGKTVYPEDKKRIFSEIAEARKHEKNVTCQYRAKRRDGTEIWLEDVICWGRDPITSKSIVTGIVYDITERKQAEQLLKESEEKFRKIFENLPFVAFTLDRKGRLLEGNKYAEEVLGLKIEDFKGKSFSKSGLLGKKDLLKAFIEFKKNLRGEVTDKTVYTLRQKDREEMLLEIIGIPLKDKDRVVRVLDVGENITERRKAEEKIKESEAQLSNAVKIAHLGPWECDVINDIFTFNDPFYAIFRTTAKQVGGYTMSSADYAKRFVHPEDVSVVGLEVRKAIETDDPNFSRQLEHRIIYPDGEVGYISVRFFIVKDEKGKTIRTYGVNQDITERKKAEEELKEAHDALAIVNKELERKVEDRTAEVQQLLKQKDEFIGQLGHDLKNPLTPLVTLIPIIKRRIKDQKSKELLDVVTENVDFMKNLVIKTLELARLNSPNTVFDLQDVDLQKKTNRIITKQQLMFEENNITVENKIDKNIMVQADQLRLDELFNNLLTNAVKFTPSAGTVTIDAKKEKDFVSVSVSDTGIGMTEEQISHIFDEFYKVDTARHDFDSSGLGLPICKRIVEKHGGKIWAESQGDGKGSTFYFTLKTGKK